MKSVRHWTGQSNSVAWCLQKMLQVPDASLDDSDPPRLQLAAQTIARVADDQAAQAAQPEAQHAELAQAPVIPVAAPRAGGADW